MSDCPTEAMKPKELPCFEPKTCGNCVHSKPYGDKYVQCPEIGEYMEPEWSDVCEGWEQRNDDVPPSLEQRYQQLEQVAKRMLDFIERVEQTAYEEFSDQLRDFGVSLDD